MTDDTAARLRALAQAAPKGPWTLLGAPDDAAPHLWTIVTADGLWTAREPVAEFHRLLPEARALQAAAGRYIAAASPDAILALLDALDEARRERDEQKRVIDDAYAALGPDAWWMDPPDGGSPTLAEMVAKANEDGRALYSVKRERDAAMALLKKHGIDYEP